MTDFNWSRDDEMVNDLINELVATRYPYQVKDVLGRVPEDRLVTVVGAALHRTREQGEQRGREQADRRIAAKLGLSLGGG